jgi:acyl carrier protein
MARKFGDFDKEGQMVRLEDIRHIVAEVLQLGQKAQNFDRETPLLGSVPEFDSMAVVSVLTALEENYCIEIDDDEVSASIFENLGNLTDFVQAKIG